MGCTERRPIKGTTKVQEVRDPLASAPEGWPVAKGSPLAQSLLKALQHIMQTGDYKTIGTNWGVQSGMIDSPVINGAIG
jgi:polar amino acid transport system substrate-binding protein